MGDYILQSDWMATEKTKQTAAAIAHASFYTMAFIPLVWTRNWDAWTPVIRQTGHHG